VVDALALALAEFGTLSLRDVLEPAIALADGFPWYEFLSRVMAPELENIHMFPSGARAYLQGPNGTIPAAGSMFRQPDLARTLRSLVETEQQNLHRGRRRRSTPRAIASIAVTLPSGSPGPCRMPVGS
jgi:gamma-glutamyltranspeptidase/glutathione hydrolase